MRLNYICIQTFISYLSQLGDVHLFCISIYLFSRGNGNVISSFRVPINFIFQSVYCVFSLFFDFVSNIIWVSITIFIYMTECAAWAMDHGLFEMLFMMILCFRNIITTCFWCKHRAVGQNTFFVLNSNRTLDFISCTVHLYSQPYLWVSSW